MSHKTQIAVIEHDIHDTIAIIHTKKRKSAAAADLMLSFPHAVYSCANTFRFLPNSHGFQFT